MLKNSYAPLAEQSSYQSQETHHGPRPAVTVSALGKAFIRRGGEEVRAVDDISLKVHRGELLVLLGPSGCGKTTLLRLIAGLEKADSGSIEISGTTVYDARTGIEVPPEKRPASMVFQSYALWPHMSVFDNVAFPLRSRGAKAAEVAKRVPEILDVVGIGNLGEQYPSALSGGQQQRVALARALVANQGLVLFDEPLSNVDAKVRQQLRAEILRIQREVGFTGVYVTHDQEEAMALGSRIAVLSQGRISQIGPPRQLYEQPANRFCAAFLGSVNEIDAIIDSKNQDYAQATTNSGQKWLIKTRAPEGSKITLASRPERWRLSASKGEGQNVQSGRVEASIFLPGSLMEYLVRTSDGLLRVWAHDGEEVEIESTVWVSCAPEAHHCFSADGSRTPGGELPVPAAVSGKQ